MSVSFNDQQVTEDPKCELKGLNDEEPDTITIIHVPDKNVKDEILPGKRYVLTKAQTKNSELIDTMVEGDKITGDIPIPASYVTEYALDKAIEYLQHHGDEKVELPEKPLKSKDLTQVWKNPWDAHFITKIFDESEEA